MKFSVSYIVSGDVMMFRVVLVLKRLVVSVCFCCGNYIVMVLMVVGKLVVLVRLSRKCMMIRFRMVVIRLWVVEVSDYSIRVVVRLCLMLKWLMLVLISGGKVV